MHLGGDVVVDGRQVVAVLDARRLARTPDGSALLERAVRGRAGPLRPRAVVVTVGGLLPVPIAAATAARRLAEMPVGALAGGQHKTAER